MQGRSALKNDPCLTEEEQGGKVAEITLVRQEHQRHRSKCWHILKPRHLRRERGQSPGTGHVLYLRTCHFFLFFSWVSSAGKTMWRSHLCFLRTWLQSLGHRPSPGHHHTHRQMGLETQEVHLCLLSLERFKNNELQWRDQTRGFSSVSGAPSVQRRPNALLQLTRPGHRPRSQRPGSTPTVISGAPTLGPGLTGNHLEHLMNSTLMFTGCPRVSGRRARRWQFSERHVWSWLGVRDESYSSKPCFSSLNGHKNNSDGCSRDLLWLFWNRRKYRIIMLCTWNKYNVIRQLCLNKNITWRSKNKNTQRIIRIKSSLDLSTAA